MWAEHTSKLMSYAFCWGTYSYICTRPGFEPTSLRSCCLLFWLADILWIISKFSPLLRKWQYLTVSINSELLGLVPASSGVVVLVNDWSIYWNRRPWPWTSCDIYWKVIQRYMRACVQLSEQETPVIGWSWVRILDWALHFLSYVAQHDYNSRKYALSGYTIYNF